MTARFPIRNVHQIFLVNKMVLFHLSTTITHYFLGYMFRFSQNHLQANVNHREVHSVCTHVMYLPMVYIGLKWFCKNRNM